MQTTMTIRDTIVCMSIAPPRPQPTYRIRLVNRNNGAFLLMNGKPFAVYGKDKAAGVALLMQNRDPNVWLPEVVRLPPRLHPVAS